MSNSSRKRAGLPRGLLLLLVVFFALALFYSIIIPLFEGPDEDDHFRYARFIALNHAFPVQSFEPGGGAAGHQGWQPPLYYTLVAALISPIDTSDFPQHLERNYAATTLPGDPSCCGRNLYYHGDSEQFPYSGTALAVHLARLLSILFGVITIAATYFIAEMLAQAANRELGIRKDELRIGVPLAAAAIVAFNPSFLYESALVSNDVPLAAFSALTLLVLVRLVFGKLSLGPRSGALLGLLIALGMLTKTTAIGLIPFALLVLAIVGWHKREWRSALWAALAMVGVLLLLAGWWLVRNQVLYGDPLAYQLMVKSATFPRSGPLTIAELFQISLPWLWQTFWGGPTPGDMAPVILVVLAVLSALAVIGMVRFEIRNSKFEIRVTILLLAAWLCFILVGQVQFIRTTVGADQGRYLFPAISAIGLFLALGLSQFGILDFRVRIQKSEPRITNYASRIPHWHIGTLAHWLIALFFLLALYVPLAYTLPAYARPALLSDGDLKSIQHPLEVRFAGRMQLLGYDEGRRTVKSGDTLDITLYWRALAPMDTSYRVFVHLVGLNDKAAGGADVIPARGAFPTLYWKPGDMLRDTVHIPVAAGAEPGKYSIEVGLYPVGQVSERLPVDGAGDDRALLDAVKVAPAGPVVYKPQMPLDATFGNRAKLIGYDRDGNVLVLYWQCLAPLDHDYTVFAHVLDGAGNIVGQRDQQPQGGNYPTSIWAEGEQIRDEYDLPLDASRYPIEVGLYRADTGDRLSTANGNSVILPPGEGR